MKNKVFSIFFYLYYLIENIKIDMIYQYKILKTKIEIILFLILQGILDDRNIVVT